MDRFTWNGLRHGDRVHVHGRTSIGPAQPAVVEAIVVHAHGENAVRVRVDPDAEWHVEWPGRQAVHTDPTAEPASCWRCAGPPS